MSLRPTLVTSLLLVAFAWDLADAAPPAEEVNRALGRVFEDGRYQERFPNERPPDGDATAEGTASRRPERTRHQASPDGGSSTAWNTEAFEALGWILVAALVIVGLVTLLRSLRTYHPDVAHDGAASEAAARTPAAEAPLPPPDEASRLAAEGRHVEAIHTLLLAALARLGDRGALAGSLTSREILARARLGEAPMAAMTALVEAVEVTMFGGREAGAADYRAAEVQYERFRATFDAAAA